MERKSAQEIDPLLIELRHRISDVILVDPKFDNYFYLYRWLIHHKLNLDKAEKSIQEAIKWRKENDIEAQVNNILGYESPGIENDLCICFDGVTKRGQPVNADGLNLRAVIQKYGKAGLRSHGIHIFSKVEKFMLDHYGNGESLSQESAFTSGGEIRRTGYDPSWFFAAPVFILSIKNFSMLSATSIEGVQAIFEMAKCGLNYFPSFVSVCNIINLNMFSEMVMKMLKPILVSNTFTMEFYGTDSSKWSKALLEQIDADKLQVQFGGTKTCTQTK